MTIKFDSVPTPQVSTEKLPICNIIKVGVTDLLLQDGALLLDDLVADPLLHHRALLAPHILADPLLNLWLKSLGF